MFDFITQHRSIRRYTDAPVSSELLENILEAGFRASSSGNMQGASVVVVQEKALREKLYVPLMEQDMVLEAPCFVVFCADFRRMRRWLALRDAPLNFDNIKNFMVGAIDATLVSQNVALAAESAGLGICYLGSTLANCHLLVELLELPKYVVPVVGFTLGYPAEDPPKRDRLPLNGLIHWEKYQDPSDEELLDIYSQREIKGWERYNQTPDLKEKIEQAGVKNLAQVYTMVKYPQKDHLVFSQNIVNTLKKQGFWNFGSQD